KKKRGDDDDDRKKKHGDDDDRKKKHGDDDDRKKKHGDDDDGGRVSRHAADLQHFFQNARPGLVVIATYTAQDKAITVILAVTEPVKFTVRRTGNAQPITLQARNTAEVTFDPAHWFAGLAPEAIENAPTQTFQGQNVLFIHKDHNSD